MSILYFKDDHVKSIADVVFQMLKNDAETRNNHRNGIVTLLQQLDAKLSQLCTDNANLLEQFDESTKMALSLQEEVYRLKFLGNSAKDALELELEQNRAEHRASTREVAMLKARNSVLQSDAERAWDECNQLRLRELESSKIVAENLEEMAKMREQMLSLRQKRVETDKMMQVLRKNEDIAGWLGDVQTSISATTKRSEQLVGEMQRKIKNLEAENSELVQGENVQRKMAAESRRLVDLANKRIAVLEANESKLLAQGTAMQQQAIEEMKMAMETLDEYNSAVRTEVKQVVWETWEETQELVRQALHYKNKSEQKIKNLQQSLNVLQSSLKEKSNAITQNSAMMAAVEIETEQLRSIIRRRRRSNNNNDSINDLDESTISAFSCLYQTPSPIVTTPKQSEYQQHQRSLDMQLQLHHLRRQIQEKDSILTRLEARANQSDDALQGMLQILAEKEQHIEAMHIFYE